jgi:flagellar secretion chaperone FliS
MPPHYARNAYLHATVQPETDPKRLILMLYEGALRELRLTREGMQERHAVKRGEHLSHAVAIIAELYTALDPQVTDDAMTFLRGLYQSMLVELARVAVTHDVQVVELALRYIERLKDIWTHDVMGLIPGGAAEQASPTSAHATTTPVSTSARPHIWGA